MCCILLGICVKPRLKLKGILNTVFLLIIKYNNLNIILQMFCWSCSVHSQPACCSSVLSQTSSSLNLNVHVSWRHVVQAGVAGNMHKISGTPPARRQLLPHSRYTVCPKVLSQQRGWQARLSWASSVTPRHLSTPPLPLSPALQSRHHSLCKEKIKNYKNSNDWHSFRLQATGTAGMRRFFWWRWSGGSEELHDQPPEVRLVSI